MFQTFKIARHHVCKLIVCLMENLANYLIVTDESRKLEIVTKFELIANQVWTLYWLAFVKPALHHIPRSTVPGVY